MVFCNWINSYVSTEGLKVQDLTQDLSDGVVLAVLLEKLTGVRLVDWTQKNAKQKQLNLITLCKFIETHFSIVQSDLTWTMYGLSSMDQSSVLFLLYTIATRYARDLDLPVSLKDQKRVIWDNWEKTLATEIQELALNDPVQQLLEDEKHCLELDEIVLQFLNANLNGLFDEFKSISDPQIVNGSAVLFLIATIGDFFPNPTFFIRNPSNEEQVERNWKLVIQLMDELGINVPPVPYHLCIQSNQKALQRYFYEILSSLNMLQ